MNGYTKLFGSIVTSTIWREDPATKVVWVTMLALADKNGEVQASVPGLAHVAGVAVDECEAAISRFMAPDKYSRTTEHEGRRIEEIDGGWSLLNYEKYRRQMSEEDQREKAAERQRKHRDRLRHNPSQPVTTNNASNDIQKQIADIKENIPPTPKDGVRFADGVFEQLEIPASSLLRRAIGDAIDFRCKRTGNPADVEAQFIVNQATQWRKSPDGNSNPRMNWLTWFQGQHYEDNPVTWERKDEQGGKNTARDFEPDWSKKSDPKPPVCIVCEKPVTGGRVCCSDTCQQYYDGIEAKYGNRKGEGPTAGAASAKGEVKS